MQNRRRKTSALAQSLPASAKRSPNVPKQGVNDIHECVIFSFIFSLSLPLCLSLPYTLCAALFDEEDDDERCDEEFLQLEESEETGEESEDSEQYLDENVNGIEGATPTPKRLRVTRDAARDR